MNDKDNSMEKAMSNAYDKIGQSSQDCMRSCEEQIRNAPIPAVLGAAGIGYILRYLPLAALLGGLVKLLLFLLKPAVLIFGAAKLYEMARQQTDNGNEGTAMQEGAPGPLYPPAEPAPTAPGL